MFDTNKGAMDLKNRFQRQSFVEWHPQGLDSCTSYAYWGLDQTHPQLTVVLRHLPSARRYKIVFGRPSMYFVADQFDYFDFIEEGGVTMPDMRRSCFYTIQKSMLKELVSYGWLDNQREQEESYLIFAEDCWIEVLSPDEPIAVAVDV